MAAESPEMLLRTYIGASFAVFLAVLPKTAVSHLPNLQARNRTLSLKLIQAEEQIRQLRSRRHEDAKANARVVEIFATHRTAWQQEETRLLAQIETLRAETDRLRSALSDRDEVIDFLSRKEPEPAPAEDFPERWSSYQFVARRVDGESMGMAGKLRRLEKELAEAERAEGGEVWKAAMRKQAKRYLSLAGKAEDLCGRMEGEGRRTELLAEVFHLQQRAAEARQKLAALPAEPARGAVKACFREVQRSLEVWLARIMGDLEGVLARNGLSRYPLAGSVL